jgi:hypothetical protein
VIHHDVHSLLLVIFFYAVNALYTGEVPWIERALSPNFTWGVKVVKIGCSRILNALLKKYLAD